MNINSAPVIAAFLWYGSGNCFSNGSGLYQNVSDFSLFACYWAVATLFIV
jgi:hypothetical protein